MAPGVTFVRLDAIAGQMNDNEFVERMLKSRLDLFRANLRIRRAE